MWAHAIVKFIQETGPWEEMKAVVLPVRAPWTGSRFLFLVYPNLRLLLASGGLSASNSESTAVCHTVLPSPLCRFAAASDLQSWM